MKYFKKFPIIEYQGSFVRNLMTRAQINSLSSNLLDYEMKDHDSRTDIIADKYYDDFGYDWLVNLSNGNVDPYYDSGLTSSQFTQYINKKYGNVDKATETILFWKNDWDSDDSILTQSQYDVLPLIRKKYWQPVDGYDGQLSGYVRKKENWLANTNKRMKIATLNGSMFSVGEIIKQDEAEATVYLIDGNDVYVKHVLGIFDTNPIKGIGVTSIETLAYSIPDAEVAYWTPITAYYYEDLLNESKRKIKLLDNRLAYKAEKELERILNE
jgi:hypothetical protein